MIQNNCSIFCSILQLTKYSYFRHTLYLSIKQGQTPAHCAGVLMVDHYFIFSVTVFVVTLLPYWSVITQYTCRPFRVESMATE